VEGGDSRGRRVLVLSLEQVQTGRLFDLALPIQLGFQAHEKPMMLTVAVSKRRQELSVPLPAVPRSLCIDPDERLLLVRTQIVSSP
jgi:hypothetical protein